MKSLSPCLKRNLIPNHPDWLVLAEVCGEQLNAILQTMTLLQPSDSSFHSWTPPKALGPWGQQSWGTAAPFEGPRNNCHTTWVEGRKSDSCSCWGFPELPGRGFGGRGHAFTPLSLACP